MAVWILRSYHLLMAFVLYTAWYAQIASISDRTHGFQTRGMETGEIIGLTIVLIVVLAVWKMGAKIIGTFR
jgi:hypothetical protein